MDAIAEQNLIGSLVGITARLTTGYTISLSNHALKLINITLSYNISADPRPTPIAHLGRGWRPACSPAAHMLYFYVLIYTGPEGKPGGVSRFPLSLETDGVFSTKLSKKKKKRSTEKKESNKKIEKRISTKNRRLFAKSTLTASLAPRARPSRPIILNHEVIKKKKSEPT